MVISDVRLATATAERSEGSARGRRPHRNGRSRGAAPSLVQTQSATVQSTLRSNSSRLCRSRAQRAVSHELLPGVETQAGTRGSTFNGLPQNTINITLDGVTVGNNLQTGDGFYSQVFPKMDAVEEVTVTGATPAPKSGGQGSVQIAFRTRSGTNTFDSSIYHYYRGPG